jgi:hypothetical protein
MSQLVHNHLEEFLRVFGISVDTVKVLVLPKDERMRKLIALKAFGLSELDAVRYYTAMLMAERGVVSAPNMAIGAPFNIGGVQPTFSVESMTAPGGEPPPAPPGTSTPQPPPTAPRPRPVPGPGSPPGGRT